MAKSDGLTVFGGFSPDLCWCITSAKMQLLTNSLVVVVVVGGGGGGGGGQISQIQFLLIFIA